MRVVNVTSQPRHFSYASTGDGGRTLKSGEKSPELPLERLFNPLVLRDIEAGTTQLQLSTEDRLFIEKVLAYGEKPIKVKKPAPKPKPVPKPKPPPKPAPIVVPKKPAVQEWKDISPEALHNGEISLADLQNHNKMPTPVSIPGVPTPDGPKSSKKEIESFLGGRV